MLNTCLCTWSCPQTKKWSAVSSFIYTSRFNRWICYYYIIFFTANCLRALSQLYLSKCRAGNFQLLCLMRLNRLICLLFYLVLHFAFLCYSIYMFSNLFGLKKEKCNATLSCLINTGSMSTINYFSSNIFCVLIGSVNSFRTHY